MKKEQVLKMSDCCTDCDYWSNIENKIDTHIDNEIKEYKLINIAKKDSKDTKLLMIKPYSKNNNARGKVDHFKDEVSRAKVGTTSSHK